jgi:hypothetical protein
LLDALFRGSANVLAAFLAPSAKKRGIWFDYEGRPAPIFGLRAIGTAGSTRMSWAFLGARPLWRPQVPPEIKPNTPFFGRTAENPCKHGPLANKKAAHGRLSG